MIGRKCKKYARYAVFTFVHSLLSRYLVTLKSVLTPAAVNMCCNPLL